MRPIFLAAASCILLVLPAAATPVGPGNVSGDWTAAGSPYTVVGEISVAASDTLRIGPGVDVMFDGAWSLRVEGVLEAVGTAVDSIRFLPSGASWGHVELLGPVGTASAVEYCVFRGGDAAGNADPLSTDGGGLYAADTVAATIRHCSVEWCHGDDGGGIWAGQRSVVEDCVLRHCIADGINAKGGGLYLYRDAVARRCLVTDNYADFSGGGIMADFFTGEVGDCVVLDNEARTHGGGIDVEFPGGASLLSGNVVAGNSTLTDGGGIFFWYGYGDRLEDNTIVGNTSPTGAGITHGNAELLLERNIVAFNHGPASARIYGAEAVAWNLTCVWGNEGGDVLEGSETSTLVVDPLFCDAAGGDYTLCADSDCLPFAIGALGQGCPACYTAIEASSWSRVKSLY